MLKEIDCHLKLQLEAKQKEYESVVRQNKDLQDQNKGSQK